jgi:hypothetical protein
MLLSKLTQPLAALALLAAASTSFAQFADTNPGTPVEGGMIPGPDTVLWDNTVINNTTAGIVSLQAANLPAGANMANTADDFVIPAGETWNITFIFSTGFTSAGAANPDSFGIDFHADNAGLPGALLETRVVPFGGVANDTTQELTLPTPVSLGEGTYWVSVYGIYNNFVALASERWNWSTGTIAIGTEAALQDTAGLFGGIPWTPLSGLGVTDPSALFAVRGTTVSGPTLPPPASVPTLSQWGVIAMILALLAGSALTLRRRHQ